MTARFTFAILVWMVFSCIETTDPLIQDVTDGFAPVYGNATSFEIKLGQPRPIKDPGKLYSYNNLLFINEVNLGVHVFNNIDPEKPVGLAFIEILGNTDIAIKDDVMYADYKGNITAIRLNNLTSLEQIGSVPLNDWVLGLPPPAESWFECIDPSRGVVIDWRQTKSKKFDCYAF